LNATATKSKTKHTAYIGLGSNIEPEKNLPLAIHKLSERTQVEAVSSVWRAPAVGKPAPDFLNAVVKVHTDLAAEDLKTNILRKIEAELGRVRGPDKFAPRTIDLDILVFDEDQLDEDLWRYAHLAVPLAEILPDYKNAAGESLTVIAKRLEAKGELEKQK
jgi:2-amino-4-hydroxy-6-hydroxymethyldihydropteridine diphosphokinase